MLPPVTKPIPVVNPPLQCIWITLAGLDLPTCDKNMEYKQCVDSCEIETCLGLPDDSCENIPLTEGKCVCKEGFVLNDGSCVLQSDCPLDEVYENWTEWSKDWLTKKTVKKELFSLFYFV